MMVCVGIDSSALFYENEGLHLLSFIDKSTWSPKITELVEKGTVAVAPFDLALEYDYWSYGMDLCLRMTNGMWNVLTHLS